MSQNETGASSDPEGTGRKFDIQGRLIRLKADFQGLLGRLSVNEWLTLLLAVGSLTVSYMTFRGSQDNTELRNAIQNISRLADQTKRQADGTNAQLAEIKRQADSSVIIAQAAKESALASHAQALALTEQTTAIKASSSANIVASEAQRKLADVAALAHRPVPDLSQLSIGGLRSTPSKEGLVTVPVQFRFRNVGGTTFLVKRVEFGLWVGGGLPDVMPRNRFKIDGSGISVAPRATSFFGPVNPIQMRLRKDIADAVNRNESKIFFYAAFHYIDQSDVEQMRCFAREIQMKDDGASEFSYPPGGPDYHCRT